ncbi:MAG TPA: helix-turn-helix domain-containing protein [Kineosporiaceae bacterium]|nr:helix-turn-helix domain-containing protein [Kineosporiaceae bacterium]
MTGPAGAIVPGRGGPLRAVLAAFEAGAGSPAEIAARTGLDRAVVSAAVDHLVRTGRVRAERLASGCPEGGCHGCASVASAPGGTGPGGSGPACGSGHGTPADPSRRGPVLLTLARRSPD